MNRGKERPEHVLPPELFYNEEEAAKYTANSHIVSIQSEMAERALELLALPADSGALILDVGCGSGISGSVLSANGHPWIGMDISNAMLKLCQENVDDDDEDSTDLPFDVVQQDMGRGVPFRDGIFDGCISISAIQWLCHASASEENPTGRLARFFGSLYASLSRGARAVFQFYPEDERQTELIMRQAQKAGFDGGLVIDYPHSARRKKRLPKARVDDEQASAHVQNVGRREFVTSTRRDKKPKKGSKAWISRKVENAQKSGKDAVMSKYSGRRRKPRF